MQRHLTPKPGVTVKNPETGIPLAPEGETLKLTTYWMRRIADGDVTDSAPKVTKKTTKKPAKKEA